MTSGGCYGFPPIKAQWVETTRSTSTLQLAGMWCLYVLIFPERCLSAHVALGGQVGLHGHGVLDHQLRSDLAEQVESGDTGHQAVRGDAFFLAVWNEKAERVENVSNWNKNGREQYCQQTTLYLRETPHISECAPPGCPPVGRRLSLQACMRLAPLISEARLAQWAQQ